MQSKKVTARKRIKKNKSKRYQTYRMIAQMSDVIDRVEYPEWVKKAVRDAFPDPENNYST